MIIDGAGSTPPETRMDVRGLHAQIIRIPSHLIVGEQREVYTATYSRSHCMMIVILSWPPNSDAYGNGMNDINTAAREDKLSILATHVFHHAHKSCVPTPSLPAGLKSGSMRISATRIPKVV